MLEWALRGKMPQLQFENLLAQGRAVLWAAHVQAVAAAPVQLCCGDSLV